MSEKFKDPGWTGMLKRVDIESDPDSTAPRLATFEIVGSPRRTW
jgi:hypothetical protein